MELFSIRIQRTFQLVSTYEIHYNKYTNELYLVNGGYRPTTAPAPTVETASLRSK